MSFLDKLFGCKCKKDCKCDNGEKCNCEEKKSCCGKEAPVVAEPAQAPSEVGNPQM